MSLSIPRIVATGSGGRWLSGEGDTPGVLGLSPDWDPWMHLSSQTL